MKNTDEEFEQSRAVTDSVRGIHRILQAADFFSRKALREFGLSGSQLWALRAIRDGECTTLSDLVLHTHLPPATVHGLVDLLEVKGLAVRRRAPGESRMVDLRLTAAGRRLLSKAPEPPRNRIARGMEELSAQDLSCVHRAVEILSHLLDLPELGSETGRRE